tara:strand:- start:1416 stop:1670 length:255 start_codon:yes stop_codon:yes gene_type:complete
MVNFLYNNFQLRTKLFILRTDIKTKKKVKAIKPFLNNHSGIIKWTIDIEDIDNVLKIEATSNLSQHSIINEIKQQGFYCDALED